MKPNWKGIYPALTTKFTDEDQLDIPTFLQNIEYQIEAGIHGCVIGGSLGEASTLTQKEKVDLLKAGVDHVNNRIPVIMNIAGSSEDEYCEIVEITESVNSNIIGYEVNISCPNVKHGGIEFGVNAELTESLTSKIRKRTGKLVIMKLSPNVTDIRSIAKAAEAGGADALSAINTVYGMSINPHTKKSEIYTTYGGLSGPAIKPVGLACVHKVSLAVDVPVIGIGGITSGKDAVEYILAGASAIQVGTANYRDPATGISILDDLKRYLAEQNIATVAEMIGKVETYES